MPNAEHPSGLTGSAATRALRDRECEPSERLPDHRGKRRRRFGAIFPSARCGEQRQEAALPGQFGRCPGEVASPGHLRQPVLPFREAPMLDTLTPPRDEDDLTAAAGGRPDPGGFLQEARTGAREAAAHMKDLAERFAGLRERGPLPARRSVLRRPCSPPPSAASPGDHADERQGQSRRHRHCHRRGNPISAGASSRDSAARIDSDSRAWTAAASPAHLSRPGSARSGCSRPVRARLSRRRRDRLHPSRFPFPRPLPVVQRGDSKPIGLATL